MYDSAYCQCKRIVRSEALPRTANDVRIAGLRDIEPQGICIVIRAVANVVWKGGQKRPADPQQACIVFRNIGLPHRTCCTCNRPPES